MTVDVEEFDDFLYACRTGDFDLVQQLKKYISDKDDTGNTGLHFSSANGHAEIVQFLLENGSDPNSLNETGNTALHWAGLNGKLSIVELLLANGASAEIKNGNGRSPSTLAEQQGHHDCVNKIILAMKETDEAEETEE